MSVRYKTVALGGTFDRLHRGHRQLLQTAFDVSDSVIIGITTDTFPHHKTLSSLILPYPQRKLELEQYLITHHFQDRYELIPLNDIYGTTLTDPKLEALVVTDHTRAGADQINQKRLEQGWNQLPIIISPLIKDQTETYISSTRIRQGKISREGDVYKTVFSQKIIVSDTIRQWLHVPQGEVFPSTISGIERRISLWKPENIALIGDYTSHFFVIHNLPFNYAVFDGKIMRQTDTRMVSLDVQPKVSVENLPGTIAQGVFDVIQTILNTDKYFLEVLGEEDLVYCPLLLALPLSSLIVYGQPDLGMIGVHVTEDKKNELYSRLKQV